MPSPFDRASSSIGVTVVTSGTVAEQAAEVAVMRLEPALHDHEPGDECPACAAAGDIRAMLFDLLQDLRSGRRTPFTRVIVDASRLRHPQRVIDRLDPQAPATALRDHTVARSFHLAQVI